MTKFKLILVAAVLVAGLASNSWSQVVYGQSASGGTRIVYSSWTMKAPFDLEGSISQFYMPVTGMVPLKDNLEMHIYMATASNSLELPISDVSLGGLTDLSVQVNQSLMEDQILISGGLNLPVGKTKLTLGSEASDWGIMEVLAQDFLNLPARKFGTGLGFNLLVGGATKTGNINLGGTISYQLSGAYEPYEGAGDYNPGDVIAANVSAEMTSDKSAFKAAARVSSYGTDTRDGNKVLKQSAQVDLSLGAMFQMESSSIEGGVRYLIRGRNTIYNPDETILTQLKHYGNELDIYGRYSMTVAENWTISPTAGMMMIAESELPSNLANMLGVGKLTVGSSTIFDIGIGIGRKLSNKIDAGAGFRLFTGSALGDLIDLSGYQFSLSLTASL